MLDSLTWTDERIVLFRRMHHDGLSFAAMGEALGISKNACIGKAARLKLPARRISVDRPRQKRKPQPPKVRAESRPMLRIVRAGYGNGLRVARSVTIDSPIFTCIDEGSLNKALVDLGLNDCKYIAGDPREGALYCGHPIFKRSYCQAHFERCYIEPEKRWSAA